MSVKKTIILPVLSNDQRDNKLVGYSSCFPTSISLCLAQYLTVNGLAWPKDWDPDTDFADWVTRKVEWKFGDPAVSKWAKTKWFFKQRIASRVVWETYEWFFQNYSPIYGWNLKAVNLHSSGNYDIIYKELSEGRPVVIGGLFPKLLSGRGGHIAVVVGYDPARGLIVNDPYGQAKKKYGKAEYRYDKTSTDGQHTLIPWRDCKKWYGTQGEKKLNLMLVKEI